MMLSVIGVFTYIIASENKKSNSKTIEVPIGQYYLDGNRDNEYISIIDGTKMQFVNFNIDELAQQVYDAAGFKEEGVPEVFQSPNLYRLRKNGNRIEIYISLDEYSVGFIIRYNPQNQTMKFHDEEYKLIMNEQAD